ncbi:MAG: hypothetical protein ACO1TE_17985 [Prosthecobacter sp.]
MNSLNLLVISSLAIMLTTLTSCGTCCAFRKKDPSRLKTDEEKTACLIENREFVQILPKPAGSKKDMPPFEVWAFVKPGDSHPDTSKPPLIVAHEVLGLSPDNIAFAQHFTDKFTVYMPVFFGKVPQKDNGRFAKLLLPPAWSDFVKNPVKFNAAMSWLKEFTAEISERHHGKQVGIIGQCASGAMPLHAVTFPKVGAGVICQPTYPAYVFRKEPGKRMGVPEGGHAAMLEALEKKNMRLMGVRFELDPFSPPEAFTNLRHWFGERFITHQIAEVDYKSPPDETGPDGTKRKDIGRHAHSVFSEGDLDDPRHPSSKALDAVAKYLDESLR